MSRKICNDRLPLPYLLLYLVFASVSAANDFYIVFLRDDAVSGRSTLQTHLNVLASLKGEYDASESLVYSYTKISMRSQQSYLKLKPESYLAVFGCTSSNPYSYHVPGITPQSESFKDDGLGPPPAKWKGSCGPFANFSGCNNKLIGAKYFKLDGNPDPADILSPVDVDGHGTHTSSTLAGSLVPNADLYGLAKGTARGAVPSARLAMYKVCWASNGCADMDILAAFDAAISDGVDVISISIGGLTGSYTSDSIAVGSFHALRKGILTVASAGNDGPGHGSVANHAPWLLTVAASGTDRQLRSKVDLGNGATVSGIGVSMFEPKEKMYPLASGVDVAKNSDTKEESRYCLENSMDPRKVKGKLIYCKLGSWGADSVVKGLGGIGIFLESEVFLDAAQIYMAPATMIALGSHTQDRGNQSPCSICRFIFLQGSKFWITKPAQAKQMSSKVDKDAEFAYGSGHLDPTRAVDPGLVYDMNDLSYIQFLCHEGYDGASIGSLVGQGTVNCSKLLPSNGVDAINYPTMQLALKSNKEPTAGVFRRRVTNVGPNVSVYNATIKAPAGVEIAVKPATLSFSKAARSRSFKVVVKAKPMNNVLTLSGSITWKSSRHSVRSPIVIYNPWAN
ncbi:UNVERIFIED_CONTAM: Subtilisin-like protease SBT4.14 [Sesamum radiatum]|uniref:Subtilisin-like protease SBT4.14 n=1 Tax=Sesamum radiatum TaxID=300843 RepID=A0AAW2KUF4_SESRA